MPETYPKRYFWILYVLSLALVVFLFTLPILWDAPVWFLWPIIFIVIITLLGVTLMHEQRRFQPQEIPEIYSARHFMLLLWLSVQAFILCVILHNAFYALFWYAVPLFETGDEPVFFTIAFTVDPAGFVAGAVSRFWRWAVTEPANQMAEQSYNLPSGIRYFLPVGSYVWLWKFGRGVELLTRRRIRAGGVFCAVFFLGVLGLAIIRRAMQSRMPD